MKRIFIAPFVVSLTAATLLGTALPAAASPTHSQQVSEDAPAGSLATIQKTAELRITQRLASIDATEIRVRANAHLTDSDRAVILATLDASATGLTALGDVIAADTDRASAAIHFSHIFTDYRVYAVVVPQAHYAAAADALTTSAIPRLESAHAGLVAALAASDRSTPELEATLADMRAQIDSAAALSDGVAASALAVTPADFNANQAVLDDEKAAIASAMAAARQAKADGQTVIEALR